MIKKGIDLFGSAGKSIAAQNQVRINLIVQLGILAFFLGILSQALGLMSAFQAIEAMGGVSPAMLVGGLRVSMIAPVYGLIIMIVSFVGWMILKNKMDNAQHADVGAG
ncbi:MAG: MotA/TolQ/ExbB proton channel family protein [Bacteroidota bacterium]